MSSSPAAADFEQRASRILKQENFRSFKDFYSFYLSQHSNRTCRRLHNIGSLLGIVLLINFIARPSLSRFLYPFLCGYGFAWVGHFFFEKNKPATFKYPVWSFMGDWVMLWEVISGRRAF